MTPHDNLGFPTFKYGIPWHKKSHDAGATEAAAEAAAEAVRRPKKSDGTF